jgi:hypothetical protein
MKTFKVTGSSMYGSGETRTWTYQSENKEELLKTLRSSGISIASAKIEEIEHTEAEKKPEPTKAELKKQAIRKILSSPTADELLYEMDANGCDELTVVESTGSLGKSTKTYKRSEITKPRETK